MGLFNSFNNKKILKEIVLDYISIMPELAGSKLDRYEYQRIIVLMMLFEKMYQNKIKTKDAEDLLFMIRNHAMTIEHLVTIYESNIEEYMYMYVSYLKNRKTHNKVLSIINATDEYNTGLTLEEVEYLKKSYENHLM